MMTMAEVLPPEAVVSPSLSRRRKRGTTTTATADATTSLAVPSSPKRVEERMIAPVDLGDTENTKRVWEGLRISMAEQKGVYGSNIRHIQQQRKAEKSDCMSESGSLGRGRGRKLKAVDDVRSVDGRFHHIRQPSLENVIGVVESESLSPTPCTPPQEHGGLEQFQHSSSAIGSSITGGAANAQSWEHVFNDLPTSIEMKVASSPSDRKKKKKSKQRNSPSKTSKRRSSSKSRREHSSERYSSETDNSRSPKNGRGVHTPRNSRSSLSAFELQSLLNDNAIQQGNGQTWGDLAYVQKISSPPKSPDGFYSVVPVNSAATTPSPNHAATSSTSKPIIRPHDAASAELPDLDIPVLPEESFHSKLMQRLIQRNDSFTKLDDLNSEVANKQLISTEWKDTFEIANMAESQPSAEELFSTSMNELLGKQVFQDDDEDDFGCFIDHDDDDNAMSPSLGSAALFGNVSPIKDDQPMSTMMKNLISKQEQELSDSTPTVSRNLSDQFSKIEVKETPTAQQQKEQQIQSRLQDEASKDTPSIDPNSSFETAVDHHEFHDTKQHEEEEDLDDRERYIRFADEQGLPLFQIHVMNKNDPSATGRLVVLLLSPEDRKFEFIHTEFRLHDVTTVQDALVQLPGLASNEIFATQVYSALYRTRCGAQRLNNNTALQSLQFEKSEVIVGVIDGYDGEEMVKFALPLLMNAKVAKAVKYARRTGRGIKYIMNSKELEQEKDAKRFGAQKFEKSADSERIYKVSSGKDKENSTSKHKSKKRLVSIMRKSSYGSQSTDDSSSASKDSIEFDDDMMDPSRAMDENKAMPPAEPFSTQNAMQYLHAGLVATIGIVYSFSSYRQ